MNAKRKPGIQMPTGSISGPTASVPKDPQPSVDRIDELARRILTGDILLPKFQRSPVWEKGQILTLLDSVAKGYPIGSVLLWQSRQELRSESSIADLDIDLPRPDYPVNYLLDGQQRLSAICGALYWNGDDPKSRWNIAYDLKEQDFFHLETLDDPPLHQIRVKKLADPAVYFKHVASLDTLTSSDKDVLRNRAETLFNRFKDYKVATVTLGDMSLQDVAPIFERINSTGTPLTIVDLMRAATWSPDFDLIDSIDGILETLDEKSFGTIDKKGILRNLSAALGGGFSADSIDQLRNFSAEQLIDTVAVTKQAYLGAVDFLTTHINVPGSQVIPYTNQLVVLAEIFRLLPIPTAAQYEEIIRWFWKTSISGYFSGWNTGMMAEDLRSVKEFSAGGSSSIAVNTSNPGAVIWRNRQFRLNTAHSKAYAIVLAHHNPFDLVTGIRIDTEKALSWINSKEYHHVFPQAFLKSKGIPASRINALANIAMLTSASNKEISDSSPSEYFAKLSQSHGEKFAKILNSNLISEAAYNAALNNDFETFLEIRSTDIHNEMTVGLNWKST